MPYVIRDVIMIKAGRRWVLGIILVHAGGRAGSARDAGPYVAFWIVNSPGWAPCVARASAEGGFYLYVFSLSGSPAKARSNLSAHTTRKKREAALSWKYQYLSIRGWLFGGVVWALLARKLHLKNDSLYHGVTRPVVHLLVEGPAGLRASGL